MFDRSNDFDVDVKREGVGVGEAMPEHEEYKVLFTLSETKEEAQRPFLYKGRMRISPSGVLLDGYRNHASQFQQFVGFLSLCALALTIGGERYRYLLGLSTALLVVVASVVYPMVHWCVRKLLGDRIRLARYIRFDEARAFVDVKHKVIALSCAEGVGPEPVDRACPEPVEGEESWMLVRADGFLPSSFAKLLKAVDDCRGKRLEPAGMSRMPPGQKIRLIVVLVGVALVGLTLAILYQFGVLG